jgi:hypothetical protein
VIFNDPGRIPETDPVTQHIFDQGHLVGELAKRLFPKGIEVPQESFLGNIEKTKELLEERKPLFEAGLMADGLYSRIDILNPVNNDEWDIVEVKSSTSLKDVHIQDAAFQKYCAQRVGLEINRCHLMHINRDYIRFGELDPTQLFSTVDITDEVMLSLGSITGNIEEMLRVIGESECPEMSIGPNCNDPYPCPITECWEGLPEHNIFTLYYGGKKSHELYSRGVVSVTEIPEDYKLNERQRIQQSCIGSGEAHCNRDAIQGFLAQLEYPLHFLDFETIGPALPLFDGTRPYQNIPFQFSLHVQNRSGDGLSHYTYLADSPSDPRPELIEHLHEAVGDSGSVIVYNKGFEEGILRDLGGAFSDSNSWIEEVISRMSDLILPFRSFHYYHPSQRGSCSLKSVLPAVTGSGYDELAIADGKDASLTFLTMTYGDMPEDEKAGIREALLEYCALDTEGMARIIQQLEQLVY